VGAVAAEEAADAALLERRAAAGDALNLAAAAVPGGGAKGEKAVLLYWLAVKSRVQLARNLAELWADAEPEAEDGGSTARRKLSLRPKPGDEVVVVLADDLGDSVLNTLALDEWRARRARVTLLTAAQTRLDPRDHVLVPPHRRLRPDEEAAVLRRHHVASKAALQHIVFHADPVARFMGLVPGDVVEIVRPSPTAGEFTNYRTCVER
jgi:DNA-directed RNA polymerase subunit H (RpoH/RPB5)